MDSDTRATSWSQANASCQAMYGSHLVSIHSDEERDMVKGGATMFEATSMWIGMDITSDGELYHESCYVSINVSLFHKHFGSNAFSMSASFCV